MNRDTELFVQAFWVKCREVIRPEIDARIGDLRRTGHHANVSTQEFSDAADRLPAPAGPSVKLTIHPVDATADASHPAIEFHGDVQRQAIDVLADGRRTQSYELAALGSGDVKAEIDGWLAGRGAGAPV
jgi:hypothetical protein